MEKILVIGGDKRMKVLNEALLSEGKKVCYIENMKDLAAVSDFSSYPFVVLPVPVSKDGRKIYSEDDSFSLTFEKLADMLSPEQTVFGGSFHARLKALLENNNIPFYDMMTDEDFLISNAYLTAQGALRLLLESTQDYVAGKKILIIGYGRVAKSLALLLRAVGADVYIAARNSTQLQLAELSALRGIRLMDIGDCVNDFSYIFGTVPFNVLSENHIRKIRSDCIYFELASAPFTADRNSFISEGKRYVYGGALPGKYLPTASGRLIFDYIMQSSSVHGE